jgi:hypothetical protein
MSRTSRRIGQRCGISAGFDDELNSLASVWVLHDRANRAARDKLGLLREERLEDLGNAIDWRERSGLGCRRLSATEKL